MEHAGLARPAGFLGITNHTRHGCAAIHLLYNSSAPSGPASYGRGSLHGHAWFRDALHGSARADADSRATADTDADAHATAHPRAVAGRLLGNYAQNGIAYCAHQQRAEPLEQLWEIPAGDEDLILRRCGGESEPEL